MGAVPEHMANSYCQRILFEAKCQVMHAWHAVRRLTMSSHDLTHPGHPVVSDSIGPVVDGVEDNYPQPTCVCGMCLRRANERCGQAGLKTCICTSLANLTHACAVCDAAKAACV